MQFNKKILLIALSMSFHGAVMSMQEIDNPINMAKHITEFAVNPAHDKKQIELLGNWLTQQRKKTTKTETWHALVKQLTDNVKLDESYILEKLIAKNTIQIIQEITHELKPDQDCSEQLVSRTMATLSNTYLGYMLVTCGAPGY